VKKVGLAVVGVCALGVPSAASADETIYAGPPNQYFNSQVSPDQGEPVIFQNLDFVDHDVVADAKGPDGTPLFRSEIIGRGASSPVAGTEFLTTGDYGFFCSIHPNMKGTLSVTGAGSPKPRPGSGGSGGSGGGSGGGSSPPPSSPPPSSGGSSSDTTAPSVRIGITDRRLSVVRRRRSLRVRITTDEFITIGLAVRAGRRTIGTRTFDVAAGTRTVTIRLRRRATSRLTVTATAADQAGNASTGSTRRTLRR
jgi:plastocyanin